jgi:hypothetical protein
MLANSPAAHLVGTSSEEINQVQSIVACLDNFRQHSALLVLLISQLLLLEVCRVGNQLARDACIDEILDLFEPLIFLVHEILFTEIDKIDHGLCSEEAMSI